MWSPLNTEDLCGFDFRELRERVLRQGGQRRRKTRGRLCVDCRVPQWTGHCLSMRLVFVSLHGPVILPDDVILAFPLRPSRISWKGL